MATDPIDAAGQTHLERIPTGIPGLDTVLRGGFLKAGIYILRGHPGTGKTILANQFCFNHVAADNRAIYVTLLAETHDRMMQHMQTMRFFDKARIPDALIYVNGFRVLEEDTSKDLSTYCGRKFGRTVQRCSFSTVSPLQRSERVRSGLQKVHP